MVSKIYLIRHGITEGNEKRWYYGGADLPLTEGGKQTLRALAEKGVLPPAAGGRGPVHHGAGAHRGDLRDSVRAAGAPGDPEPAGDGVWRVRVLYLRGAVPISGLREVGLGRDRGCGPARRGVQEPVCRQDQRGSGGADRLSPPAGAFPPAQWKNRRSLPWSVTAA